MAKTVERLEEKKRRNENLLTWGIYFVGTFFMLTPFFSNEWTKLVCASILISFFLSMLNRIILGLYSIVDSNNEKCNKKENIIH